MFRSEEFAATPRSAVTIIFVCPYGTSIAAVRWAIRRLVREGYDVLAYAATKDVFLAADPAILPDLIGQMRKDIRSRVARLRSEGVTEFGFFGSSLGSFILYNCIGDGIPELRWGVFNTGGNIARGMWRLPEARRRHLDRGWSLTRLEAAWADLQCPDFGRLDGCRFIFVSSRRDRIAPLDHVWPYIELLRRAGAEVSVFEVPAIGHVTAVIAGLAKGPRIIRLARPGVPPRCP
jgi:biotin operon repressor